MKKIIEKTTYKQTSLEYESASACNLAEYCAKLCESVPQKSRAIWRVKTGENESIGFLTINHQPTRGYITISHQPVGILPLTMNQKNNAEVVLYEVLTIFVHFFHKITW